MEASGMVGSSPQKSAAALRQLLERTQGSGLAGPSVAPFGVAGIDAVLPGGGLALGAVHEICEQGTDSARAPLASLFAAAILARLPGPVLWCQHSRDLFAPALARVGLHPDRVIYCETWKDAEVLPAMEEGLRHGGLAGVVGELVKLPLTPSRRLQLTAESSGVVAFALRRSGPSSDQANACFSRWRVGAAPSGPMN
jgi:protein ImuA